MGRKRVNNMKSKGLGKCSPKDHSEQCGNAWDRKKQFFDQLKPEATNPFEQKIEHGQRLEHLENLEKLKAQANTLEKELERIKEKLLNLNAEDFKDR